MTDEAWYWSDEHQRELDEQAEGSMAVMAAAYELQEAELDVAVIYKPTLNRDDIGGPGSVDEHVRAIQKLVEMLSDQGTLFVYQRALAEYDPGFDPPARKITKPAALKELISRAMYENDKPLLWKLDWRGNLVAAAAEDILPEAFVQLTAAGRWPGLPPAPFVSRQLPGMPEQPALPPGLPDQLEQLAGEQLAMGTQWRGSKQDLAAALGWASVQRLNAELVLVAAELAVRGLSLRLTGDRTVPQKRIEWELITSSPPHLLTIGP